MLVDNEENRMEPCLKPAVIKNFIVVFTLLIILVSSCYNSDGENENRPDLRQDGGVQGDD